MPLGAPKLSNDQVTCWTCPHGFAKNETCLNYPEDKGRANTCRIGFHDHCRTLIIGNFRLIHTCAMVFSVYFMDKDIFIIQTYIFHNVLDDPVASWHYHRECARKGPTHRLGCVDTTITIEGEGDYAGRECYCKEDLCNNQI